MRDQRNSHAVTGQTLVELALVLPLLIMFLTGLISFGIGVFYQQQVANAAREAARYAAIHSATDPFCPTASWLAPLQAIGQKGSVALWIAAYRAASRAALATCCW